MSVRNYINKSKEHILYFLKKATTDHGSLQYAELFNNLLKMFVDCDKSKDGIVDMKRFNELVDTAALTPRLYGFAPTDDELYKTKEEKTTARNALFESMNEKGDGRISFNEFLAYTLNHIKGKAAGPSHPTIEAAEKADYIANLKVALSDKGSDQHTELYWYLLEIFLESAGKDLTANARAFSLMVERVLEPAKKLGLAKGQTSDLSAQFSKLAAKKNMVWAEFLGYCEDNLLKSIIA
jgi:Ca2+-binding EF-hand superfamily protein